MANDKNNTGPSQEQLDITNAMAKAMQAMLVDAKRLEASFVSQARAIKDMCDAMECFKSPEAANGLKEINNNLNQIIKSVSGIKGVGAAITEVGTNARSASDSTKQMSDSLSNIQSGKIEEVKRALDEAGKSADKSSSTISKLGKSLRGGLGVAANFAGGAISGVSNALKLLFFAGRTLLSIAGTLVKGLFSIGKALLAVPIAIIKKLFEMANEGSSGISELAEALNEMKKEFGSLGGPTNSAMQGMVDMTAAAKAGINVFKTFGTPAERLKEMLALYTAAGPNLRSFSNELVRNGGALLAFQRGLGLSAEAIEALSQRSKSSGQELTTTLINVTKYADAMARRFKLDAKVISREMGKAAQDMTHFGNISEKQIGIAVAYAQKLGIQLDKITGSFDKFSTFDDAAENISKLNEAFGANIDVGEVMMEQDPAKQFEMIRRGLMAAGVRGEQLSFAQRKLIETTAGWDSATAIAALSTKNAGIALKDFQKEADKAEKKTMDQTEALKKLAGAMHENLKAGQMPPGKGIFDRFIEGMMASLKMNPSFRRLMNNIRRLFVDAFMAGKKFGDMLLTKVPFITKAIDALANMFEPGRWNRVFSGTTKSFGKFLDTMKKGSAEVQNIVQNSAGKDPEATKKALQEAMNKGPVQAFRDLKSDIGKVASDFFGIQAGAGSKIFDSVKEFFKMFVAVVSGAVPFVMETMASIISKLADFIANPKAFIEKAKAQAASAAAGGKGIMAPLIVAVSASWPKLQEALEKLFKVLLEKFKEFTEKHGPTVQEYFKKYIFSAALSGGLSSVITGGGMASAAAKIIGIFTSIRQASKIAELTKQVSTLNEGMKGLAGGMEAAGSAGTAAAPGIMATLGPIIAVTAAVLALVKVYEELSAAEDELARSRQSAQREIEESARNFGEEGLRIRTGVGKSGKVELKDEELYEMYKQRHGPAGGIAANLLAPGVEALMKDSAVKEMREQLQKEYDLNLGLAKKADEERRNQPKKIQEELKKKAQEDDKAAAEKQAQENYESLMEQLGYGGGVKIDMSTFKQKIEELDKLSKTVSEGAEGLQKSFDTIREKLGGIKFNLFAEDAAKSAEKVKEMESALKALQNFHGFIVVIGRIIQDSQTAGAQLDAFGTVDDENSVAGKLKKLAKNHSDTMNEVVKAFTGTDAKSASKEVTQNMKQSMSDIKQLVTDVSAIFSELGKITSLIVSFAGSGAKIDEQAATNIRTNIESMEAPISEMFSTVRDKLLPLGMTLDTKPLIDSISGISKDVTTLKDSYNNIGVAAASIQTTVPAALTGMMSALTGVGEQFMTIPEVVSPIVADGAAFAIQAVKDIYARAREIEAALESGMDINFDAKLRAFATSFGKNLGASGKGGYSVKAKEVVMNVSFKVAIDVQQLEGALLGASNSKIKDRINLIIDALPDTDAAKGAAMAAQAKKL